jgi:signal peptide peptidase SppA
MATDRDEAERTRSDRAAFLAKPRLFRPEPRFGEMLAMRPEAADFSFLFTGVVPTDRTKDNIAIVSINGPLEHHENWMWDSYECIIERIEDALTGQDIVKEWERRNFWNLTDEKAPEPIPASAVVLRIDSPGGEAAGATWCHRRILGLRKKYGAPVYAFADEMVASAAYEIASACDEIWGPDTAAIGSIGVIATLFDRTRQNEKIGLNVELITSGEFKADGHADRPITDEIRERMQDRIMILANIFWRTVAKARGTSPKAIASLEAGVFIGQDAVDVGIADGVANWGQFLKLVAATLDQQDDAAA